MRICMLNMTSGDMCWGYRNYLMHLIPRLAVCPDVEALVVGMPETVDPSRWFGPISSVKWLRLRCSLSSRGREISRAGSRQIADFAPDVLFIPTTRYWSLDRVPVVNMVQNMMPATPCYSKHWLDRVKTWGRFAQMRRAIERSRRIIAVSGFVRTYLTTALGISADKVGVVYHGTELSRDEPPRRPGGIPDDWLGNFLFTAGSIYPYRGLEDIIRAWDCLPNSRPRPPIAIAGFVGRGMQRYYDGLKRLIREKNLDSHIRFIGAVTPSEMAWCYRNCSAFIMTSRVEACPNIALEAMANGCLCISTQNPPLPEIFDEAARYYPAGQPDALVDCIGTVLGMSPDQQREMKTRATDRASQFTWDACCDGTVAQLKNAIRPG